MRGLVVIKPCDLLYIPNPNPIYKEKGDITHVGTKLGDYAVHSTLIIITITSTGGRVTTLQRRA